MIKKICCTSVQQIFLDKCKNRSAHKTQQECGDRDNDADQTKCSA